MFNILYTCSPNKSYAYWLSVEPSNLVLLKTFNTEFDEIIINLLIKWLGMEDKVSLRWLINKCDDYL